MYRHNKFYKPKKAFFCQNLSGTHMMAITTTSYGRISLETAILDPYSTNFDNSKINFNARHKRSKTLMWNNKL